jgi:(3S)-malyl-CoA thioesterase
MERIMTPTSRPFRSVLYVPGANARALEKARTVPADALIFDLEDAVSPERKTNARAALVRALAAGGYGRRARLVRINGLGSPWGRDDLHAFGGSGVDAILIPKVNAAADVDAVAKIVPDVALWAMIETPAGVLAVAEIAAHPRVGGLVIGSNDLAKELGSRWRADRAPLLTSLHLCLLAARAHGIVCIDGVYNAFKDADGLARECEQGRDIGLDGKTLIHPAQIDAANAAFAPSKAEIDLARRQIAAFDAAAAAGQGVAVVDGRIVENLHIETARATLARMDAIAAMEG